MNSTATQAMPHWMVTYSENLKTPLEPLAYLYQLLMPLQTVEALYADWRPEGFEIWMVANQTTVADREQIYTQEWALMQKFPMLGFDFHFVDRSQSDAAPLISLDDADFCLRLPRFVYA